MAWNRESDFDRIETTAERNARYLLAGFDSEPFYTKLYNPKVPHTLEEYTLEIKVDVERLRMEILRSQPALPRCDLSLRRSPAIGTGSDEPGVYNPK